MTRPLLQVIIVSLSVSAALCLKSGALSDIHVQPFYDAYANNSVYCTPALTSTSAELRSDVFSDAYAPLGKLYCDPPQLLFETFVKKLKLVEPDIDVLFMTGDFVGHEIPIELDEADNAYYYQLLTEIHSNVSKHIAEHLPNTLIIPSFGNNDFKYHYNSPDEDHKTEFYSYIFDLWFTNMTSKNRNLSNLEDIKTSFLKGGYYRVDITDTISALALNTIMFAHKNQELNQGTQQLDQLEWIELQLNQSEPNRKFIITNHIYPAVKYENETKKLWHSNYSYAFVNLLEKYTNKIIIEISGHDHVSDIRYQKGKVPTQVNLTSYNEWEEEEDVSDHHHNHHERNHEHTHHHQDSHTHENGKKEDSTDIFNYHNIIINPGLTSATGQNPGFSLFEIDTVNHQVENLRMIFLPIEKTYNWTTIPQINEFPWREIDFSSFGLEEITPTAIDAFKERLEKDTQFLQQFLALKIGYNPNDPVELQKALNVFQKDLGVLTSDFKSYIYICQMSAGLTEEEFNQCIKDNTPQKLREMLFLKWF